MTQYEQVEWLSKNARNGICVGDVDLECGRCPANGLGRCDDRAFFKEWLQSNGGTMNNSEALSRLDAIEKEQAELRKIIEKGDKIKYDSRKIYIALKDGSPYIMVGKSSGNIHFNMHSFDFHCPTCISYTDDTDSAQECIDLHIDRGFTIHAFDSTKEALQFFIDHL